jgi:hypothetical protein
MLALSFMSRTLRIVLSCLIPFSLAVLCEVAVPLVLGEKINCSDTDVLFLREPCLSETGEFLVDVLRYGGLGLILVGIVLPFVVGRASTTSKIPKICGQRGN